MMLDENSRECRVCFRCQMFGEITKIKKYCVPGNVISNGVLKVVDGIEDSIKIDV